MVLEASLCLKDQKILFMPFSKNYYYNPYPYCNQNLKVIRSTIHFYVKDLIEQSAILIYTLSCPISYINRSHYLPSTPELATLELESGLSLVTLMKSL